MGLKVMLGNALHQRVKIKKNYSSLYKVAKPFQENQV